MSDPNIKIPIPASLMAGAVLTQEERLQVDQRKGKFVIGIPKESTFQENRIALVPSSVAALIAKGYHIYIEAGAGEKANFSDRLYAESGATIIHSKEEVFKSDVLIKVAPPTMDEIDLMHPGQILLSPLHLPMLTRDFFIKLKSKRVIAIAIEYIQDQVGSFPVVRSMSEMAGISTILIGAELLSKSKGVLFAGISGVPPAKVCILGAGVVAENATRTALGLGAEVRIFDNNTYKLMRLQTHIGQKLFTSSFDPEVLDREIASSDLVIGAIHSKTGRAPIIITENMVSKMKPGSVIIDASIDQGGCFETSKITTHDDPTFEVYDVIHYCVPNISSKVPQTASQGLSNILTPLLMQADDAGGIEKLLYTSFGLRHGVYTYKGSLTNPHLGDRFQINYTDLDLLITSNL
ncbi:MAG TPA: alanine dehydrogenase [Saprospiraceae bacterium]|nr:alanine dehydrogenase [Saprospiraceae bacterium]HMV23334.1 alanine dehydrogenase [Saprospiraceae bacterium]HMX82153.1 alanine dehydrogenase [Saprospiraceae bacterium]HMX84677.1 alanine dehydrogenase [Saprospiraceae bacterium]HMZ73617.1 alanine dehydrogenase [Saprospiraceae bacterium]